jgi:hypothetical protein
VAVDLKIRGERNLPSPLITCYTQIASAEGMGAVLASDRLRSSRKTSIFAMSDTAHPQIS